MKTITTFGEVYGRPDEAGEPPVPDPDIDGAGDMHEWEPLNGGVLVFVADEYYPNWGAGAQLFQRWTKWVMR